jgi:iron complex transport system substrate-binding protein
MRPTADRPLLRFPRRGVRYFLGLFSAVIGLLALMGACNQPVAPSTIPPGATGSILPALTGTPPASPSAATSYPLTLVDDEGTTVQIPAEPRKIVSLTPATTEVLFAIGAGDRVIAKVEDVANYPPEAAEIPIVGTFDRVDVEKIVGLDSDLVIAGGSGGTPPDAIQKLRSLDIPVVVVYADDVDGVFTDIELTGAAVGAGAAAKDLAASMRAGFDQVASATASLDKPRVFYETGDTPAIFGVADESFVSSMLELAGAQPITTGSSTNWEMSIERLVDKDPQIILLGDAAYGVTPDAVKARAGWSGLTAVKREAIEPVDDIIVTRPGPRLLDGLRTLVGAIHPDAELPEGLGSVSPSPAASSEG